MKKLFLSLTFLICILFLTACAEEGKAFEGNRNAADDNQLIREPQISEEDIQVICTTLTKSLINLEYVNNGTINWGYGLTPYFQQLSNETWTDVEPIADMDIPEIWADLPADGGHNSFELSLSKWYGDLADGHYRLGVKLSGEAGERMLWYEFEIATIID